jgi:hypothetical protein
LGQAKTITKTAKRVSGSLEKLGWLADAAVRNMLLFEHLFPALRSGSIAPF